MKMKTIVSKAKKIRARLLRQQTATGYSNTEMARLHGVSVARMWLQLKKAREEKQQSN